MPAHNLQAGTRDKPFRLAKNLCLPCWFFYFFIHGYSPQYFQYGTRICHYLLFAIVYEYSAVFAGLIFLIVGL